MNENENIEKNDDQSCCPSGSCPDAGVGKNGGKMKYAAFGFIMLLAAGVAANALIEKHKNPNASTCGTNACTTCPSQLGGIATCDDSSSCSLAAKDDSSSCSLTAKDDSVSCPLSAKAKTTDACCPSQKTDAGTCSQDSVACPSEKTCGDAKTCDKAKACCGSETCGDKTTTCGVK